MDGGARIPDEPHRPHTAHLDTCYLRPILLRDDEDQDLLESALRTVYAPEPHPQASVSIPVLGEFYLTLATDVQTGEVDGSRAVGATATLLDLLGAGKLSLCGTGAHGGQCDPIPVAAEIREVDYELGTADVLALAAAFACDECELFYTSDFDVLKSQALGTVSEKYRTKIRPAPD